MGITPRPCSLSARRSRDFPHERRKIIFTAAGDRRDEDIVRQGQIVGDLFDEILLYEDGCVRGRADGEVTLLVREGLASGSRVSSTYETRGELNIVEYALKNLMPGDLLVIQADYIDKTIAFVQSFFENRAEWPDVDEVIGSLNLMPAAVGCID